MKDFEFKGLRYDHVVSSRDFAGTCLNQFMRQAGSLVGGQLTVAWRLVRILASLGLTDGLVGISGNPNEGTRLGTCIEGRQR
jgi:hypothetical protein